MYKLIIIISVKIDTWHPGVKAPRTENRTPLFPLNNSWALTLNAGLSTYRSTDGTGIFFCKKKQSSYNDRFQTESQDTC